MTTYFPVITSNFNSNQSLQIDQNYYYNSNTDTLNINNIKVNNIIDNTNSSGFPNQVLIKNNNNELIWSLPQQIILPPCSLSQYIYYIKNNNFSILPKTDIIIGATNYTTFNKDTIFTNNNILPYAYITPFSSDNQQYSHFLNSSNEIDITVYKIHNQSLELNLPINLIKIKEFLNIKKIFGGSNSYVKISKSDIIFVILSNKSENITVSGTIDLNILFMM